MGRSEVVSIDPAVRKVQGLPRSQAKVGQIRLVCKQDKLVFDSLIQAWVHSELHGPWAPTENGSRGAVETRSLTRKAFQATTRFQTALKVRERLAAMRLA
jgi:hypothetical protein